VNDEPLKIRQVLRQIADHTVDMVAEEHHTSVAEYLDLGRLRREESLLFRHFPVAVAHSGQLAAPGDFVCHDDSGVPIVVVRDRDNHARAFLNVCRHRGARVVCEPAGHRTSFACPYHAWTYGLDGRLLGMPWADGFCHLDRAAHGLRELPVVERFGLLWVCPSPGSRIDADRWFAPLAPDLDALQLDGMQVFREQSAVRQLHWKLALDGFLETYHFRYAHAKSAADLYLDNQGAADRFYPHLRYFIAARSFPRLRDEDARLRDHALIVHFAFPCTFVQTLADHNFVHTLFPLGPDRCVFRHVMLVPGGPLGEKAAHHFASNWKLVLDVFEEDFAIGEAIQRNLSSGANDELVFGRQEQAIGWVHGAIEDALAGRLTVPTR
jgi:phenylpropionate dioxygenase-like ring-hydroxylating dioxygenase large terminal subunit